MLITTGLLMFGFVAYQLWGTGLEYSQAQNRLENEFDELIGTTTTTVAPTTSVASPPSTAPPTTQPPVTLPAFAPGDAVAKIEIPSIGLTNVVVSGVEPADLKKGPGHYPTTPMPGQLGNAAVAGHRTTYGQPFFRLDEIQVGDEIIVTTLQGRFVYRATGSEIVGANASEVVATTDPTVARLTLTTCHPKYSASKRLIVFADLDTTASPAPFEAVIGSDATISSIPGGPFDTTTTVAAPASVPAPSGSVPASTPVPADVVATTAPAAATTSPDATAGADGSSDGAAGSAVGAASVDDAFSHGWFSDRAAIPQVVLWGVLVSLIAIGGYLVARHFRRSWVGVLVGLAPFVVALYFFFQNVNRLLPAAL